MNKNNIETIIEEALGNIEEFGLSELLYLDKEILLNDKFIDALANLFDGGYEEILTFAEKNAELADFSAFIEKLEDIISGIEKNTGEPATTDNVSGLGIFEDDPKPTFEEVLDTFDMVNEAKKDPYYIMGLISRGYWEALKQADDEVRSNPDIILEAVKCNPSALTYASDALKRDEKFIQELFELGTISNEQILEFASEELREIIEIFFSLRNQGIIVKKIFDLTTLRQDINFILGLLEKGYPINDIFKIADISVQESYEFWSSLVDYDPSIDDKIILEKPGIKEGINSNESVVLTLMSLYGIYQLEGANKELLSNPEFIWILLNDSDITKEKEDVYYIIYTANSIIFNKEFRDKVVALFPDIENLEQDLLEYASTSNQDQTLNYTPSNIATAIDPTESMLKDASREIIEEMNTPTKNGVEPTL